jgi:predicted RecA/RadA family phage recombinase
MADFVFRRGNPQMVPFTPSADLAAGQGVLLGNATGVRMGVMHRDAANAATDAEIAVHGGVYDCKVADNYAAWSVVYFDGTDTLTTTSTNNALFGVTVEASAAANAIVEVFHHPLTL